MSRAALPLLLTLGACAGGASTADYPSLAIRPIETRSDAIATPETAPPTAADAALVERLAALDADARTASEAFQPALARAAALAEQARGDPVGSDAWIAAQFALVDADAARASAWTTLRALDDLVAERVTAGSTDGLAEIDAARATAAERVSAQEYALAPIRAALER